MVAGGDAGFETVVLTGKYDAVGYEVSGQTSGVIRLDAQAVTFDGMEPVQFTQDGGTFTYKGTAGDDTINIHKVVGGDGTVQMEISGTGETVQFANPSEALVVEAGDGADTITVQSLHADFAADLKVYGRDGEAPHLVNDHDYDSVKFAGSISTNGGYLEAFAESI